MESTFTHKPGGVQYTNHDLMALILPLVVEQILVMTIGLADTLMVTSVGEAAVSGISLVDSINIIIIQVFAALATGGAVVSSQYIGCGDRSKACEAAKQLYYTVFICSSVIMLLSLLFKNALLTGIFGNTEADVMQNARTYFWITALSFPFIAIYNSGAALFRSMGNSRISMYCSLLMNVINISGNALLIYVFKIGVAGAALATLTSRIISAVIVTGLLLSDTRRIYIKDPLNPELDMGMIKRILRIGIPNGLENGMFNMGKLLVQRVITPYGTTAIAANAIASAIVSFANVPGNASGLGMITVIGQNMGANHYDEAEKNTRKIMRVNILALTCLDAVIFLLARPIVGFFDLTPETTELTVKLLHFLTSIGWTMWCSSFVLPNALRAAGDARFTMLVSITSMWIFRVGFAYLLGGYFKMSTLGVWIAMYIDWIVRAACFEYRFRKGHWKTIKLI